MVGVDGRTPVERLRGRGVQRLLYELGEKVLFFPLAPARLGGARFDNGIYLGIRSFDGQAYNTLRSDQMLAALRCFPEDGCPLGVSVSRWLLDKNPHVLRLARCPS